MIIDFVVDKDVTHLPDWWRWPHFSPRELACRCCGKLHIHSDFLDFLERVRKRYREPMIVSSGYRCLEANKGRGPAHNLGKAADILAAGQLARRLVDAAVHEGVRGLGISQAPHTPWSRRFIHLDMLGDNEGGAARPMIWSY